MIIGLLIFLFFLAPFIIEFWRFIQPDVEDLFDWLADALSDFFRR